MRRLLVPALLALAAACTPAAAPPRSPDAPRTAAPPRAAPAAPTGDPWAIEGTLEEESLPLLKPPVFDLSTMPLPPAPKGVPPAPAKCAEIVKRKGAGATPAASCKDAAGALAALDKALAEVDPVRRDAMLVDIEACAGLPVGLTRALRAEAAPTECADAMAEPLASAPPKTMTGIVYHALFGHVLAGRLARTVQIAPKLAAPYDKKRVADFINGPMAAWIAEQAQAIQDIVAVGAKLPYYGKAVVAVEAGIADMRFVDVVRGVPVPDEYSKDKELRDAYYGNLDRALDPRKDRGRDAALVGLRELAFVGVIRDRRVDRARALLSQLYGGRRIDALDALVLPPLPPATPTNAEERLAARLPTFYAGLVLDPGAATKPAVLRMLVESGLSVPHRVALKAAGDLPPEVRVLYARARLELGQRYWRRVDFEHAGSLIHNWPAGTALTPEATLMLGLALALRGGPEDASEMMRKAPAQSLTMGRVGALDSIAHEKPPGKLAGPAAFDAAVIRQVAAPQNADAAYWKDVARRFREAGALVDEARLKAYAEDRARAAEETAAAIK